MEFKGQLSIRQVEKKPFELEADETHKWVQELLKRAAPSSDLTGLSAEQWAERAKFRTRLRVEKLAGDYLFSGDFEAQLEGPCARCGDLFETPRVNNFQLVLHPQDPRTESEDEDSGDPDYVFFQGESLDITQLLAEQLIILEPFAEAPPRADDGKCLHCGKNPQFGEPEWAQELREKKAGQEVENKAFSAFSELAGLKNNKG